MSSQILVDWILASCTFVLFLAYHLYLFIRVRYWPLSTVIGVNHLTRRCWVEDIMLRNNGKDGILAVQSLRNGIMASSLLASTSILLASTLAGFAASSDKWTGLDVIVVSFVVEKLEQVFFDSFSGALYWTQRRVRCGNY